MTLKDAKLQFVTDAALSLFLERSISGVTVKDIAKKCGLGEATVYRYFSCKNELVAACAVKLQTQVEQNFLSAGAKEKNGFFKLKSFYEAFLKVFSEHPEIYRFLSEFDAFCIGENIDLEEYADNIDRYKASFMFAYREGVKDKSVRRIKDIDSFYYSSTHALLSLCKKLAAQGNLIRQDDATDKAKEIKVLTETLLFYIKGQ